MKFHFFIALLAILATELEAGFNDDDGKSSQGPQAPNRQKRKLVEVDDASPSIPMDMGSDKNEEWVSLNVGGQIFTTTRTTLCTREPNSMLARMFCPDSSILLPAARDSNGAYLIDRSPKYFEPILNYLRHGELILDKNVNPLGVTKEAEFYDISGLLPKPEVPSLSREDVIGVIKHAQLNQKSCNLSGANLSRVDLRFLDLKHANLVGANLEEADLSDSNLSRANMYKSNLKGAILAKTNMEEAILKGANLQNAKLSGTNLRGADLENSDITGSSLDRVIFEDANVKGIKVRADI